MKSILKYELDVTDIQTLKIPQYYDIVSVQVQNGVPCLWALVDPEEEKEKVKIRMVMTGEPLEDVDARKLNKHLGTLQMDGGNLVAHVYEVSKW